MYGENVMQWRLFPISLYLLRDWSKGGKGRGCGIGMAAKCGPPFPPVLNLTDQPWIEHSVCAVG